MSQVIKENTASVNAKVTFKQRLWVIIPVVLLVGLISSLIYNHHAEFSWDGLVAGFDQEFLIFFLIGVFAQLVDGTLGMGYGATSTSFLLAYGIPPAISSTGVHVAEMFTTGASAISHHRFGNINKKLVRHLLIPGVLGNPESLAEESHNEEGYLEYPNFTKPSVWRDLEVPAILLSGNHGEIAKWRAAQAVERAKKNL